MKRNDGCQAFVFEPQPFGARFLFAGRHAFDTLEGSFQII